MTLILILISFTACGLFLIAEKKEHILLKWISKSIASGCFILIALTLADVSSSFSNWMILGFTWCFIGDLALIKSKKETFFLFGIIAFGLGHICFGIAFILVGSIGTLFTTTLIISLILMILSYNWLRSHLKSRFRILVPLYILIIGSMVALSGYAWEGSYRNGVIIGAVLFALSDVFVAREAFVKSEFRNKLIGLPLYYLAQIILALSLDW